MKFTHIAGMASCILFIAGCNQAPTDQGGTSQNSPPATGSERSPASMRSRSTAENSGTVTQSDTTNGSIAPSAATQENAAKPADNTGRNVRDRSDATLTPTDQSESKGDVELTQRIRRAVTESNQLSTTAKNVKIIDSGNGKITLRGPVNSAAEKEQIERLVQGMQGVTSVDDQLEVKVNQ